MGPLALTAVLWLARPALAEAPRAPSDPADRLFAQTCLPPPYLFRPEETDHQAHLRCGGRGESFCLELRAAFVGRRLPRLPAADVRAACGGPDSSGSRRWLELRDAISALVRGHSYTPAERQEVERALRSLSLIYSRPGGPGGAELEALRRHYLDKAFVLSPEQDRENLANAERLLAALERRLPQAADGTLEAEALGEWTRFVEFVEAYIITPGSGLAEREEFLRRFAAAAATYDVHEYLTRRVREGLAAPRGDYFRDGRLTEAGQALAQDLARGRSLLRAVAHLDIAEGMSRAQDGERPDWGEQRERTVAAARRTAEVLAGQESLRLLGEFERSSFVRRRDAAAPPPPHARMDPGSFPAEFPAYFVRAAPDRAALIYRFSESHFARLGAMRPPELTGLSGRLTAASRELYHYLVEKECLGPRDEGRAACEQRQRSRAEELVRGATPFQRGLSELAVVAGERQRREELWDDVKHFIPGYDCYALVSGWGERSGGQSAAEGAMCVLGVMPLARATARLGQTALSRAAAPAVARPAAAAVRPSRVVDFTDDIGDGMIIRGLRIPEYGDNRAYLRYRRGRGDAGEPQIVIDYVAGVPGVPGVGHELKRALLERFPQATIHSQLTNVNRKRLLEAVAANRYNRPTLEQLQARVPAMRFPGYEYRITVSDIPADGVVAGSGIIRLEMRPLVDRRTALVLSDEDARHLSALALVD